MSKHCVILGTSDSECWKQGLFILPLNQMLGKILPNIIVPSWMTKTFHNTAVIMQKSRTNDTHHCLTDRMVKSTVVSSFPFHGVTFPALWSNSMRPLLPAKYHFKYSHFEPLLTARKEAWRQFRQGCVLL